MRILRTFVAAVAGSALLLAGCGITDDDADGGVTDTAADNAEGSSDDPQEEPADADTSEEDEEPADAGASEPDEESDDGSGSDEITDEIRQGIKDDMEAMGMEITDEEIDEIAAQLEFDGESLERRDLAAAASTVTVNGEDLSIGIVVCEEQEAHGFYFVRAQDGGVNYADVEVRFPTDGSGFAWDDPEVRFSHPPAYTWTDEGRSDSSVSGSDTEATGSATVVYDETWHTVEEMIGHEEHEYDGVVEVEFDIVCP